MIATTQVEAAKALGVTRQAFIAWTKFPDAPRPRSNGKIDLDKWREYIKAKGLKGVETTDDAAAKTRYKLAQCEAIEFRTQVAKGKYYEKTAMNAKLLEVFSRVKEILVQRLENELPVKGAGQDAYTLKSMARTALDAALRECQEYIAKLDEGSVTGNKNGA